MFCFLASSLAESNRGNTNTPDSISSASSARIGQSQQQSQPPPANAPPNQQAAQQQQQGSHHHMEQTPHPQQHSAGGYAPSGISMPPNQNVYGSVSQEQQNAQQQPQQYPGYKENSIEISYNYFYYYYYNFYTFAF